MTEPKERPYFLVPENELLNESRINLFVEGAEILDEERKEVFRRRITSTLFSFLKSKLGDNSITPDNRPGQIKMPVEYKGDYKAFRKEFYAYLVKALDLREQRRA